MWAHWLMTVFGSVLRHSSLQAAAVALFMGPQACVCWRVPDVLACACMSHVGFYGEG